MIRIALALVALMVGFSAQAANVLHVKAGQTETLEAGRHEWVLDELVLEDGATLVIPAATRQVQIDAIRTVIGKGAKILAGGSAGVAGAAGANVDGQAEKCTEGKAGAHGAYGGNGSDGVSLNLTLRVASLGSLAIETQGGAGGEGA